MPRWMKTRSPIALLFHRRILPASFIWAMPWTIPGRILSSDGSACRVFALWLPGTDHASIATEVKIVEKLAEEA